MVCLQPVTLDEAGISAAREALRYFIMLCNRPITYPEYEVARETAIKALSVQIVDNKGKDYFEIYPDFKIVMDYSLVRMGVDSVFEMIALVDFHGGRSRINFMEADSEDNLHIYTDSIVMSMYVPGICRASDRAKVDYRFGGIADGCL